MTETMQGTFTNNKMTLLRILSVTHTHVHSSNHHHRHKKQNKQAHINPPSFTTFFLPSFLPHIFCGDIQLAVVERALHSRFPSDPGILSPETP